jgi:DNA-binding NarL/FixJ family response regulator
MNKKALIVEDQPVITETLIHIIGNLDSGIHCINATTGKKGLNFLNGHHFEIIILNTNIIDLNCIEFCGLIRSRNPKQKILAIVSATQWVLIEQLYHNGVNGVILKSADSNEMSDAVKSVLGGNCFFGTGIKELLNIRSNNNKKLALTKRELEILSLISEGLTNHEIADKLFVCCSTVDSHRKNLLLKFNVHNSAKLIKMAVLQGIVN